MLKQVHRDNLPLFFLRRIRTAFKAIRMHQETIGNIHNYMRCLLQLFMRSRLSTRSRLFISLVFVLSCITGKAFAQTDLNIQPELGDVQAQYQRELDKWTLQAYEGNEDAQFKVGVLFSNKQFGSFDYEQSAYWYKQAARQGHALAQFNLGHQYLIGQGVPQDEKAAMSWWLKAAEQDHALASFNVGRAYYLGIGLEEDHDLARHWFERAAQNKEPKSIEILEKLGWAKKGQYRADAGTVAGTNTAQGNAVVSASTIEPAIDTISTPSVQETPKAPIQAASTSNSAPLEAINSKPITQAQQPSAVANPLSIYTDPAKRSVLIMIIENRDGLNVLETSKEWSVVSRDEGLPVWVHSNFIRVSNNRGTITGSNVNARSVPLVTSGTVVGQLNKDEVVDVLDQQKDWYRVQSPSRFKGWAKTAELNNDSANTTPQAAASQNEALIAKTQDSETAAQKKNDLGVNEWLFAQDVDSYTLQLASFNNPNETSAYETRHTFIDDPKLQRLSSISSGTQWTYFLYGSYDSKEKAEVAKIDLKQNRAWIRTFGRLQENRCLSWKQQIPAPSELNKYCVQ